MKITGMKIEKVQIPLKEPFKVAFATVSSLESVLIGVTTEDGLTGYGLSLIHIWYQHGKHDFHHSLKPPAPVHHGRFLQFKGDSIDEALHQNRIERNREGDIYQHDGRLRSHESDSLENIEQRNEKYRRRYKLAGQQKSHKQFFPLNLYLVSICQAGSGPGCHQLSKQAHR